MHHDKHCQCEHTDADTEQDFEFPAWAITGDLIVKTGRPPQILSFWNNCFKVNSSSLSSLWLKGTDLKERRALRRPIPDKTADFVRYLGVKYGTTRETNKRSPD